MKVIFMGTSAFGAPALKALIEHHQVRAVFTQEPKPQGRGLKLQLSHVHKIATQHNINVHTPKTLRTNEVFELVKSIEADVIVVCSYGFIVPSNILNAKKYGCLNIHPSLLPKYRGAAPLQRAIISGDDKTAVCIMQMDEGLDTGALILSQELLIHEDTTYTTLHDECADLGAKLLLQTLEDIEALPRVPQETSGVSYAHKLTKEESLIDWNDSAKNINCKVRGMNPWPGTFFMHDGNAIKVLQAKVIDTQHNFLPGAIVKSDSELHIACGNGILAVEVLQKPGSRAMLVAEFLKGHIFALL